MNNKINKLEELAKSIEKEKNIDTAIDNFIQGAGIVKDVLGEIENKKGKVYEVIDGVEKLLEE